MIRNVYEFRFFKYGVNYRPTLEAIFVLTN